ncbi:MAG: ABC transporter permease [Lachnospiraceae bacterium]|nr:ABC transporter permease [Lachnospiraceae bacterium]
MIKLIKNEFIKLFCKASTWVLLVLLALSVIGVGALVKLADYLSSDVYYSYDYAYAVVDEAEDLASFYESELKELEEDYAEGWWDEESYEVQKKEIEFCADNEIPAADYYGYNYTWRSDAIYDTFWNFYYEATYGEDASMTASYTTWYEQACQAILDDDWKLYYQTLADYYDVIDPDNTSTWHMIADYYYAQDTEPDFDAWDYEVLWDYSSAKIELDSYDEQIAEGISVDQETYDQTQSMYLISKYRLDNQIEQAIYYDYDSEMYMVDGDYFSSLDTSISLVSLVSILMIIFAGGIIAKEFSMGTIKFYLINPVSRRKLFWSKYLTILLLSVFLTIVSFLGSVLVATLMFGLSGASTQYLYVADGELHTMTAFLYILKEYALNFAGCIPNITLAFAISALARSSSLAIGLSIAVQLCGSTITSLFALFNLDFGRYLLFANTDLSSLLQGTSMFANHTIGFALCTIVVYMVVFLLTGYDGFTRREV